MGLAGQNRRAGATAAERGSNIEKVIFMRVPHDLFKFTTADEICRGSHD
jgi:hypothetical protein